MLPKLNPVASTKLIIYADGMALTVVLSWQMVKQ